MRNLNALGKSAIPVGNKITNHLSLSLPPAPGPILCHSPLCTMTIQQK